MVSSQLPSVAKSYMPKSFRNDFLQPLSSPDVPAEQVELDFSDVFGPLPIQALNEPSNGISEGTRPPANMSELVYDDPEVICNRSHSLVGPSSFVSQSLKLGRLTLHETEDSVELIESLIGETIKEDQELNDSIAQEPDNILMTARTIGLEDFEVMKVVGQGAFGKVFQVKKKGTSEIYAMKVMRKDKIMEKNHAEYMKAERDILTKIDHPFVVQLRYSFQVNLSKLYFCYMMYLSCSPFF